MVEGDLAHRVIDRAMRRVHTIREGPTPELVELTPRQVDLVERAGLANAASAPRLLAIPEGRFRWSEVIGQVLVTPWYRFDTEAFTGSEANRHGWVILCRPSSDPVLTLWLDARGTPLEDERALTMGRATLQLTPPDRQPLRKPRSIGPLVDYVRFLAALRVSDLPLETGPPEAPSRSELEQARDLLHSLAPSLPPEEFCENLRRLEQQEKQVARALLEQDEAELRLDECLVQALERAESIRAMCVRWRLWAPAL